MKYGTQLRAVYVIGTPFEANFETNSLECSFSISVVKIILIFYDQSAATFSLRALLTSSFKSVEYPNTSIKSPS